MAWFLVHAVYHRFRHENRDIKSGNSLCKVEIEHVLIENVALN